MSTAAHADGRPVRTEIEEVSIGAADWTDGDGTVWKDAPVHLALTPLPVWVPEGGQPPFEAARVQQFGTRLYRFASEKPPMADDKKEEKAEPSEGGGPPLKKVLEMLKKAGIPLPDDTTEQNFMERIYVAANAIQGGEGGGGGAEPPPAPAPEGDAGAFMSTLRGNPLVAMLVAEAEATRKEKRLNRIAALKLRGLPEHQAKKYREEAGKLRFSADNKPAGLDERLDALDAALPPEGAYAGLTHPTTPGDVKEATPPEGEPPASRHRELADEMAKTGRLPARRT